MKLNQKHQFILFSLYQYLKHANKKFNKTPLEMSVSKINFIELLRRLKITEKSRRGLYKNLQILEKKKLIHYENKFLKITAKGIKAVNDIENNINPYLDVLKTIKKIKEVKPYKDPQAYFK